MGSKLSKTPSEDVLQMLSRFDTVIIVDDSLSMMGIRWREAGKALSSLAAVASKYDSDGIEIQFLNSHTVGKNVNRTATVKEIFSSVEPGGMTPIGRKLDTLLRAYLAKLEKDPTIKPVNYVVITDGAASTTLPEVVIVNAARELDRMYAPLSQVGIQFVQIGQDEGATRFLETLDNRLKSQHDVRDIVDTTVSEEGEKLDIVKILMGGINRRFDDAGSGGVL
ncbi:hypothetical protein BDZ94DRAFT_1171336 [Collybia nuda]|uniref:VWFA domain-containing protein n=1 Tax=Collybia nuda TaxID=64659 RepID=A0A9P6CG47_9AGAR|nr:hypothetical protein BDZ94DRAFT_1171336 [Collybia nuda]